MDKLIEFIKNIPNSEFKWLTLLRAVYTRATDTLTLVFEYNGKNKLDEFETEQIKSQCKKFLGLDIKIEIAFKKITVNMSDLKFDINKFIAERNDHMSFDQKKITYDLSGDNIAIHIPYDGLLITDQEINDINVLLDQTLEAKYLTKFQLNFAKKEVATGDILKEREQKLLQKIAEEQKNLEQKIIFTSVFNILGNLDGVYPVEIRTITKPQTNVVTAGTIKRFTERTFVKKKEDKEEERKYYSFDIDYDGSVLNCVLFLSDEALAKFVPLHENDQVLVGGDTEQFNGKINMRVKSLATCVLTAPKPEEKAAKVNYEFVLPEPYVMAEQINFFQSYDTITKPYLLDNSFVVFDLETTGLNYEDNKIIEIGAVKVVNGKITEQFSTFVNPQSPIPSDATMINGITDDMVKDAPTIEQVLPDFYKFCLGSVLVAYNTDFDYSFINYNAKKLHYIFNNKRDDAMIRARQYLKGLKNYKLKTVCESQDISLVGAHRAVNDTVATAKLFIKLIERYL